MKKWIGLLALVLLANVAVLGQDDDGAADWKDKVYFGGNGWMQFGTLTRIEVSPLVGYRITDRYSAGVGINYQYFKFRGSIYSTSVYGTTLFNRYLITDNIFLHGEAVALKIRQKEQISDIIASQWIYRVPLGAGFRYSLGGRVYASLILLYDVLYDIETSPFSNPEIRAGVVFGL